MNDDEKNDGRGQGHTHLEVVTAKEAEIMAWKNK